ncbi:hypothetical protein CWI39_0475p0010 [Hamiltosporidium magnivora]|uniref:Uncharacterized protein n=1 Tax=Hamiltosporidium magnivora TaxID=148818 RepID=A0A4Q9LHS4_9MICR|nr:hypothetical protein CWI39_0475p0010 [Hamiltosporidium magnivora]
MDFKMANKTSHKEFQNASIKIYLTTLKIECINERPRNPKASRLAKRVNQTIKRYLAKKLCVTYPKNCIDFNNNVIFMTEEINNDLVFVDEINSEVLTSNNPDSGYTR